MYLVQSARSIWAEVVLGLPLDRFLVCACAPIEICHCLAPLHNGPFRDDCLDLHMASGNRTHSSVAPVATLSPHYTQEIHYVTFYSRHIWLQSNIERLMFEYSLTRCTHSQRFPTPRYRRLRLAIFVCVRVKLT